MSGQPDSLEVPPVVLEALDKANVAKVARVAHVSAGAVYRMRGGHRTRPATLMAVSCALDLLEKQADLGKSMRPRKANGLPGRPGETPEQRAVREANVLRLAAKMAARYEARGVCGRIDEWTALVRLTKVK